MRQFAERSASCSEATRVFCRTDQVFHADMDRFPLLRVSRTDWRPPIDVPELSYL
jgi:hypothetical protein